MEILFSSESLAHAKSNEPQNSKIARFSFFAIFNYSKNLLFQTRPRRLVRLPRKLAQIIFRPCWQKVMEFKLIRPTVVE